MSKLISTIISSHITQDFFLSSEHLCFQIFRLFFQFLILFCSFLLLLLLLKLGMTLQDLVLSFCRYNNGSSLLLQSPASQSKLLCPHVYSYQNASFSQQIWSSNWVSIFLNYLLVIQIFCIWNWKAIIYYTFFKSQQSDFADVLQGYFIPLKVLESHTSM